MLLLVTFGLFPPVFLTRMIPPVPHPVCSGFVLPNWPFHTCLVWTSRARLQWARFHTSARGLRDNRPFIVSNLSSPSQTSKVSPELLSSVSMVTLIPTKGPIKQHRDDRINRIPQIKTD